MKKAPRIFVRGAFFIQTNVMSYLQIGMGVGKFTNPHSYLSLESVTHKLRKLKVVMLNLRVARGVTIRPRLCVDSVTGLLVKVPSVLFCEPKLPPSFQVSDRLIVVTTLSCNLGYSLASEGRVLDVGSGFNKLGSVHFSTPFLCRATFCFRKYSITLLIKKVQLEYSSSCTFF